MRRRWERVPSDIYGKRLFGGPAFLPSPFPPPPHTPMAGRGLVDYSEDDVVRQASPEPERTTHTIKKRPAAPAPAPAKRQKASSQPPAAAAPPSYLHDHRVRWETAGKILKVYMQQQSKVTTQ